LGLVLSDETDTMEQLIEEKRKSNDKDIEIGKLKVALREAELVPVVDNNEQIIRLETERDMYKAWFEKLMEKAVV
ncbi:MAG: hypothetical protein PUI14_06060, partial [Firmicutes bacterium]|nr:hypothetical protein [Bacillota bacterium]